MYTIYIFTYKHYINLIAHPIYFVSMFSECVYRFFSASVVILCVRLLISYCELFRFSFRLNSFVTRNTHVPHIDQITFVKFLDILERKK